MHCGLLWLHSFSFIIMYSTEQIASGPEVKAILNEWNIEDTDSLMKKLEEEMTKRKEMEQSTWKSEEDKY